MFVDVGPRPLGDASVFVLDAETSECLHYEPVSAYPATKMTRIPRELLDAHPEIEIRNDLIDCSIDVCSVEVCVACFFSKSNLTVPYYYRSLLYSKTTSTTKTSGETSCTASSHPTS